MSQPASKRQLRPDSSLPTTAEIQAQRHGIDPDVAAALQSVGRRGRASVQLGQSQHRTPLGPTQSLPTISSSSAGFETAADTIETAHKIISKESWRQREVAPFASNSTVDTLSLSPRGARSTLERERKLKFGTGGEWGVEVEEDGGMDWEPSPVKKTAVVLEKAKKRDRDTHETEGGGGSDTEVEDDDDDIPPLIRDTHSPSSNNDFPPVFTSPALSHPELFQPPSESSSNPTRTFSKRPFNPALARVTKSMPGKRGFGKTMSAPVGGLGLGGKWGGGDVEMEDGFDIQSWTAKEDF